nr:NB-ARC domain-containing protein [Streptomyces sp. NBC_01451]
MAVLAGTGTVLAAFLGLAANKATSDEQWPGPLDLLRQHPWPWVGVLIILSIAGMTVTVRIQEEPTANCADPPAPPVIPGWFVDRSEVHETVRAVCRGGRSVAITTSLWGAGGFGKTTLATAVCANTRVQRHFRSRVYIVTIGRDVRGRAAIASKVAEVTRFVTGDQTAFEDPDLAGSHLGRLLDRQPRTLVFLDDVWEEAQLRPFLLGGERCVRLVTTRNPELISPDAPRIHVDQMSLEQAFAVLTWNLPPLPAVLASDLLQATGRWALLLRLTNRLIAEQVATAVGVTQAATEVLEQLRSQGPNAFADPDMPWDLDDPQMRSRAVRASIEAATTRLPSGGDRRFAELGIFAEDESIPVPLVILLWKTTGGLTEQKSRSLCRKMERLSLLTITPVDDGRIRLHDVIRDYLRSELGDSALTDVNAQLLDAVGDTLPQASPLTPATLAPERAWWENKDGYLRDHLISHLLAAGRDTQALSVAGDLRWIESRLVSRGANAPQGDLARIPVARAQALAYDLTLVAHLLTPTTPSKAVIAVLHSRLPPHSQWRDQITARQQDPALRPLLANRWPPPDYAGTRLHHPDRAKPVEAVAISADNTWLATGGFDRSVRIWHPSTGNCIALGDHYAAIDPTRRRGHASTVRAVAIARSGTWLATSSDDNSVRIWDPGSGDVSAVLRHTSAVRAVAIAPHSAWLATTSDDQTARVWDRSTQSIRSAFNGHAGAVRSVAISPDATWVATGGDDATVQIWDPSSGEVSLVLGGHTGAVRSVAISPDGAWMASGSEDTTVKIWDPRSGQLSANLEGHSGAVRSVAISPSGTWIATASDDWSVRIWDVASESLISLQRANRPFHSCAWGSEGLVVAGGALGLYLFSLLT